MAGIFKLRSNKKNLLCSFVFFISLNSHAQVSTSSYWTWKKGDSAINVFAVYGMQGVASAHVQPNGRTGAVSWTDTSGNLWLFGGAGYSPLIPGLANRFNDLWKYNPTTNEWTWMKGDSLPTRRGVYGSLGVAAPANNPGSRTNSTCWVDASNNLWLFGGNGIPANTSTAGSLNDLWKYNTATNQWTWIKGDSTISVSGVYGSVGVPGAANKPGGRESCNAWIDGSGNFWLFGGSGRGASSSGSLNDLWKYDPSTNQWTWMKGDITPNIVGVYGLISVSANANKPGGRAQASCWKDASGDFWLFGGSGYSNSTLGRLNDLWKYSIATNQWTWIKGDSSINVQGVYGNIGTTNSANKPGARVFAVSWKDNLNNLWLFGGSIFIPAGGVSQANDLWKYNTTTNEWTWMKGDSVINLIGVYGTQGVSNVANKPGSRTQSVGWTDKAGKFWLFAGTGFNTGSLEKDLWRFDPAVNEWTWMQGVTITGVYGIYGTQGVAGTNFRPGGRRSGASWTDADNNLWLFGGSGNTSNGVAGALNDLWKYNPTTDEWMWVKGDNTIDMVGRYGSKGMPSGTNNPGARETRMNAGHKQEEFWLFGGQGYSNSKFGYLNDLWRYDVATNNWAWIIGDSAINNFGIYGNKSIPDPANKPGARSEGIMWTDTSGNLWLFGGFGYAASGTAGLLNDLWKYDKTTNQWVWVSGDNTTQAIGIYGSKQHASGANKPGSRTGSVSWTGIDNTLWLFGGRGYAANTTAFGNGELNDLWKFNQSTNEWTWISGDSIVNQVGIYGTMGIASNQNKPGGRSYASAFEDVSGNLCVFAGGGYAASSPTAGSLNDLWLYNRLTNQWTWIKGDSTYDKFGNYGQLNVPSVNNLPGSRYAHISWTDSAGSLWIFGGFTTRTGVFSYNDQWVLSGSYSFKGFIDEDWAKPANWTNNMVAPNTLFQGAQVIIDPINGLCTNTALLAIQAGAALHISDFKTLDLKSGLDNQGSITDGGPNAPGFLSFSSNNPSLSGSVPVPMSVVGTEVTLNGNASARNVQLLNGGKIKLNSFNLELADGGLSGYDVQNYIITNDTGKLFRTVGLSDVVFPVGPDAASYTPIMIGKLYNTRLTGANAATADFRVSVKNSVEMNGSTATRGVVNKTWNISRSDTSSFRIAASWNLSDELPGFDRNNSYIALSCPPPDNCITGFEVNTPTSLSGTGPFTLARVGPFLSPATSFIIRSAPVHFEFTGAVSSNWNNHLNWAGGVVAPLKIIQGVEITINENCTINGQVIMEGGTLTVKTGKQLTIVQ